MTVKLAVLVTGATPGVVVLPVTVTVVVLAVAPAAAVMVTVVLQVGLQEGTENAAVTPAGSAESEKATGWVVPARSVAVTTVDPGTPPAVTVTVPGLAASE